MLFDIAAIVSSSGALGGVAEAFVVHENSRQIVANFATIDLSARDTLGLDRLVSKVAAPALSPAVQLTSPSALPASFRSTEVAPVGIAAADVVSAGVVSGGVDSGVEVSPPSKPSGSVILDQMTTLTGARLDSYLSKNSKEVRAFFASPAGLTMSTAWWSGLPASKQAFYLKSQPELLGNLDGLPVTVRDRANRTSLKNAIATLTRSMNEGMGRGELVAARAKLHMLEQVGDALVSKDGVPRQLLNLDPANYGRAAVVVGDLSTADYVSYLVPGMFFTVDGQMVDWTVIAKDLNDEQKGWVKTLAKTDPSMAGKKVATVAWIGYQTPGLTGITSLKLADQGAAALGNAIKGMQQVRAGHEPFITIIGHSYGSTAAMIELAKGGVDVDALVVIGSPGSAAQSAKDLSVRHDNVYVGEASWDPVVNTAFYGSDPGSPQFGAKRMDVAGGTDPITQKKLAAAVGHLGYFDAGTTAMRNLALIGLNRGSLVTNGTTLDASRTLR
jgi:hypothetical protein